MNLSAPSERSTDGVEAAIESAQTVFGGDTAIPGISLRDIAIFVGITVVGLLILGARHFGVPTAQVLGQQVSTENALTLYTTFAGIGGFLANIIASTLISTIDGETVAIQSIIPPILIQILGAVIAAASFPSGGDSFI